ncbi:hypothetical protein BKA81DRAFT_362380 [Phyllosticta paracitricarpa]
MHPRILEISADGTLQLPHMYTPWQNPLSPSLPQPIHAPRPHRPLLSVNRRHPYSISALS